MINLLQINASINNGNGQSSRLASEFISAFRRRHPDARIVVRDVATMWQIGDFSRGGHS